MDFRWLTSTARTLSLKSLCCRHVRVTPYPVDLLAFVWLGLGVRFARDEIGA